ncbi:MAG: InlB B-repeat-containing protein, partial [Oribacterium sp.]|nr:InlB B-repeat-containing protein [Oribacterium sp.]
ETVYAPTTPEKTGSKFLGWSYTEDVTALQKGDPGDFVKLTASVKTTGDVKLYPVFQEAYYVFFLDAQGRVSTTKEGVSGDVISVSDVKIPLDSTHSVTGWYTEKEFTNTNKVDSVTLSDRNVTLYPKVEEGHYLYFSSGDGASYVKPVFVAAEKGTVAPDDPTRPGYTFLHWSEREEGSAYTFGSSISEDTTLYAVWEAKTDTTYTVIFWKQSVLDKKNAADNAKTYDYAESVSRTGTTGVSVSPKWSDQNKGYTGFTYNSAKSMSVTINGDGTTILNVYYDRNLLTINFNRYVDGHWEYVGGFWGGRKWIEGHWDSEAYTGLYGQTLAQNGYTWPSQYKWYTEKDNYGNTGGTNITFLDAFISDDYANYGSDTILNLYGSDEGGSISINHYKQNLDGSYSYDSPANSTKSNKGTFTFTNKYTGFTISSYFIGRNTPNDYSRWSSVSAGSSTRFENNLYVRYTRNSYNLAYYNYNGVVKKESLLYEAPLNSYSSYIPDRPVGLPEAYTFQGWFKDKECTVPFDFDSIMPANDVMIYAKWAAPTYTGTVHMNIEGTGTPMKLTINYGDKINENDMPTVKDADSNVIQEGNDSYKVTVPAEYTWAGWATKSGDDYTIYNFNTEVYSDITLYPYYINGEKYTVSYHLGKGTGKAPADNKQYAENSYADIMSASGITAPEGKTFLYWTDGSNNYYPGDKVKVTADLELTAFYGDTAQKTSITYHSNYPADSGLTDETSTVDGQDNNTAITLEKAGFASPTGYYFAHWEDASGNQYAVGKTIGIDNTSANNLNAVWEKKKEITLKANSGTFTYDGTTHSASGVETDIFTINGVSYTVSGYTTSSPERKDAGNYSNIISGTYVVKDGSGADVTDQFTVNTVNGSLTINKRTVNLKSESAGKAYDGTALTKPEVTVTGDGFAADEVSDVKATGTITKVGSTANPIAYTEGTGFKADNYEITRTEGTLTITQNADKITVTAGGDTKVYDGTPLTKNTYSITGLPEGFTAVVIVSGTVTDAGAAENKVTSVSIRKGNEDVTSQFSGIETVSGTLTVTKRTVTLKSESESKAFDGTPLTKPDVTVGGDGFVDGEVSDLKATGSITKAGSVVNTIEYTENSGFKADNYTITKDEGTLTITKNDDEIIVNARNASKMYDGMPLTEAGADVTGLPEGFTAAVKTSGSITNAGTADNVIDSVVISNEDGEEVTGQFSKIKKNNGELTVNQRSVILTSKTAQKEYDGTPLTASEVTVSGDGFVEGEVSDLMATGSITDVGSTANTITYSKVDTFIEINYSIERKEGTLKITPNTGAILVTADSAEKTYDGTLLTADSFTAEGLPEGFTAEAEVRGAILDAGTAENVVENIVIRDKEGRDATRNFDNIAKKNGLLTVNKRNVTFTSASASKEYDGSALTAKEVTISGDGFIDGEGVTFNVTGSRTEVGTSLNTFEYTLNGSPNKERAGRETGLLELLFSKMIVRAAEQITKEENYSIQVVYGTLTVTAKSENSETSTTTNTTPTNNVPSAQISVGVQKVWVDNNNAEGLRPDSITVQLYRNGDAYGSPVTLSAGNGWAYTWSGLEAGASYGVVETSVPAGYTSSLGGDQNSGYVLTNTLMPTISGNYGDGDAAAATGALPTIGGAIRTGDESNLELWLLTFVMAAAAVIAAIVKKRKKGAE